MFYKLTSKQKRILNCDSSKAVVKACPGSGKTYSVTARLAKFLKENKYKHQGIAVISFTNIAAEEIRKGLLENYDIDKIEYPHFIGTIDSFINKHIFLPFGHLLMKCNKRPEIVGTEYNPWYEYDTSLTSYFKKRVTKRDPNYYFDKVSFDSDDKPLPLMPPSSYHFSWKPEKITNQDGSYNKKVQDIIKAKWAHFNQGKANQADANYFSLKILNQFPDILAVLSKKYSHIIVDEAQDTTDIQMKIIDLLLANELENLMIVGDPRQAIFEWNTADVELFQAKYDSDEFYSIDLDENRRSSENICSLLNKISRDNFTSIADVKNDDNIPEIIGFDTAEISTVQKIKSEFLKKCAKLGISQEESAILFRGKNFGERYFQLTEENPNEHPWKNGHFYVRDIAYGKYLIDRGKHKEGLKLLEKGYHQLKDPTLKFVSKSFLKSKIEELGFREYRKVLFGFIDMLPLTINSNLKDWVSQSNENLKELCYEMEIQSAKGNVKIENLFHQKNTSNFSFTIGTIHSVKGQTFDAVLLFLIERAGQSKYVNIIKKNKTDLTKKQKEELRLIYVACSRPKRLLWVAVPTTDVQNWREYFGQND